MTRNTLQDRILIGILLLGTAGFGIYQLLYMNPILYPMETIPNEPNPIHLILFWLYLVFLWILGVFVSPQSSEDSSSKLFVKYSGYLRSSAAAVYADVASMGGGSDAETNTTNVSVLQQWEEHQAKPKA